MQFQIQRNAFIKPCCCHLSQNANFRFQNVVKRQYSGDAESTGRYFIVARHCITNVISIG